MSFFALFEQLEVVLTIRVAQKTPLDPLDDIRIAAVGQVKPVLMLLVGPVELKHV
jgi:hypothetical protein